MPNHESKPDDFNPYVTPQDASQPTEVVSDVAVTPEPKPQPHVWFAILWSLLLVVSQLAFGLAGAVVLILIASLTGTSPTEFGDPTSEASMWLQTWLIPIATLATLLTSVGVVLILYRANVFRTIAWRGCSPVQWCLTMLAVIPMSIVASETANWMAEIPWLPSFGSEMIAQLRDKSWLLVFLAACVLPGIGEEIFFRGFLSRGLCARHGVVAGTILASVMFGAVHVEPVQACGAAVMGLALQWVFLSTRSLWAPIVLHTTNNALAFAALKYGEKYFPIPGYSYMPNDELAHTPILLFLAGVAASVSLCWAFYTSRTQWTLPSGEHWSPGYVTAQMPDEKLGARPTSPMPSLPSLFAVVASYAFLAWAIYSSMEA